MRKILCLRLWRAAALCVQQFRTKTFLKSGKYYQSLAQIPTISALYYTVSELYRQDFKVRSANYNSCTFLRLRKHNRKAGTRPMILPGGKFPSVDIKGVWMEKQLKGKESLKKIIWKLVMELGSLRVSCLFICKCRIIFMSAAQSRHLHFVPKPFLLESVTCILTNFTGPSTKGFF